MASDTVYQSSEWQYDDFKALAIASKEDIKAIRQEIYDDITSDADLSDMNSTSRTSKWQLFLDVIAYIMFMLLSDWVRYEARLKEAAKAAIPHTAYWYYTKALAWQYGDSLTATDGTVMYSTINPANQIVKSAAVKESGGLLFIKVAKLVSGNLVPLSLVELTAFEGYIDQIKDAGVTTKVVTLNADLMRLGMDIYYNPRIPLPSLKTTVFAAINGYLAALPFDGVFRKTKLEDALQGIEGVIDMKITQCDATVNYVSTPSYTSVDVFYETIAGYIAIDPAFPLTTQINFVPYV